MIYKTTFQSPLGELLLASDGENLVGLWVENQKHHGDTLFADMIEEDSLPIFSRVKNWLEAYFDGKKPKIEELPLAPIGGEFRQTVWSILCQIPYGELTTYGEIAQKVAAKLDKKKTSARAVGGAVGRNPISIIIPCHRVVGSNGSLIGYASGIDNKKRLLALENSSK